jgi:hypothetical protein
MRCHIGIVALLAIHFLYATKFDPETFARARDRALAAQGDYASDVLPRTASALEEMGAKLYLNETGSGGIATNKLEDDGRTEAISGFNLPKGAEGRGDLDLTKRAVMKLDGVNVAECMKSLAEARLKPYGYKTVATLPLEARMPAFWPEGKPKNPIHSLVRIPSLPPSPNTLDKEAVECVTQEQFYEAGRQAYLEMHKNYRLPAEQD